jgi:hypothetical protein
MVYQRTQGDILVAFVVGGGVIGSLLLDVPNGTILGAVIGMIIALFLSGKK